MAKIPIREIFRLVFDGPPESSLVGRVRNALKGKSGLELARVRKPERASPELEIFGTENGIIHKHVFILKWSDGEFWAACSCGTQVNIDDVGQRIKAYNQFTKGNLIWRLDENECSNGYKTVS